MAEEHPLFMYLILARPPEDDDDEPPILDVEHDLDEALRWCREMGGAVVEKSRRADRLIDGAPEYEHVEYIYPEEPRQRGRKAGRRD